MRRLLPAAVASIVVTALVYGAVAPRGALPAALDSMQAALLYVANWYFIAESADYFAPGDPSPVLHFWSLAVEEQFYVVWPLLLAGLWRLAGRRGAGGARRRHLVAGAVAAGAAASFVAMLALRGSSPTRAYFGTDTRAYQLLVGAGLALLPGLVVRLRGLRPARLLAPAGLVGVVAIATSLVDQGPFVRGAVATASAAALIVGVEAHDRSVVARGLSLRPVAYLGTISYATYLWHWPIIVVVGELGIATTATTLALLTALLATAIAALSSELLELPIRRSPALDRHRLPVIAGGLAVSVAVALLVVPPLLDLDRPRTTPGGGPTDASAVGTPVPASFDFTATYFDFIAETVDCQDAPPSDCTVVEGEGPHLLLVGDSNAVMYVPAFTELARAEGLRLSVAARDGCPWQDGFVHLAEEIQQICRPLRADTYDRLIPALDPDVIVLVNGWLLAGGGTDSSVEPARSLALATEASFETLEATGAQIVVVPPPPVPPAGRNPLECLREADAIEECRFIPRESASWLADMVEARAAASDQVHLLDLDHEICPSLPRCDAMVGEVPVFWNPTHITRAYSETLAIPIGRRLAALQVIPPLTSTGD